jgi:ABC-type transporter Mla subunit MlaD
VELEELRQRLLLRSKSSDIPPVAHPVQVPEVALSQAASKVKWETSLSPEVAARIGAKPEALKHDNADAARAKETSAENPMNVAALENKPAPVEPISMLATTVENLSQPTEAFREHFANLGRLMEPIDRATESTEQALRRIVGLHEHLSSLASNFQSVRAFAEQVKALSASFEPMKGLNSQLDMVTQALYASVKEVDAALGPVKTFQGKVRQLAAALDSMDKLQGQISALAETFRPAAEKPATAATKPSEKPAPVAQAA